MQVDHALAKVRNKALVEYLVESHLNHEIHSVFDASFEHRCLLRGTRRILVPRENKGWNSMVSPVLEAGRLRPVRDRHAYLGVDGTTLTGLQDSFEVRAGARKKDAEAKRRRSAHLVSSTSLSKSSWTSIG